MKQTYTFLIEYKVLNMQSVVVKNGSIRCKNKEDEEDAQRSLRRHLLNTVPGAGRVLFGRCVNETKQKQDADVLTLIRSMVAAKRAGGNPGYSDKDAIKDIKGAVMGRKPTATEINQRLFGDV